MTSQSEGQCQGEHRFFVCETFIDEITRTVQVILACTACGKPKVNEISLKKES